MKGIIYRKDKKPTVQEIITLYSSSGINRPINDIARIEKMYANSNLVFTAWDRELLVGIAKALTDFCYCCYVSDLAIMHDYQKQGIGKQLLECIKQDLGSEVSIILLAAPSAEEYYPKVGFDKINNGFIIKRTI